MKVLVLASVLLAGGCCIDRPAVPPCPYGPDQCKAGFVWREAYAGDHVCVTGDERHQAAEDKLAAPQRRLSPLPFADDRCKPDWVWREAIRADHVCVSAATRGATARQNEAAATTVDPRCRYPGGGPSIPTEYLVKPTAPPPPKPPYAYVHVMSDGSLIGVSRDSLAIATDAMWNPGDTLTVHIGGSKVTNDLRTRIQRYASEWSKWGNVSLRFVADPMAADIRVAVEADNLSWSQIGRDALNVQAPDKTMNFGWLTDATDDGEVSRVVTHEFGHALGLIHEHQSPAAGISWDRPKVIDYYEKNDGWTEAMVQANIFDQASADTTNFSAFDPFSIMEYEIRAEWTTYGYSVGFNRVLSDIDKQWIRVFYPFPPGSQGTLFTGDDCDTIGFQVVNGVAGQAGIRFILRLGPQVSWWKSIRVPVQGGGFREIEAADDLSGDLVLADEFDPTRPIGFGKAKFLGAHTSLGFTWDIGPALAPGSLLMLDWNRDHC